MASAFFAMAGTAPAPKRCLLRFDEQERPMIPDQDAKQKAVREAWLRNSPSEGEIEQIGVVDDGAGAAASFLVPLFAGLAAALAINTVLVMLTG